MNAISGNEQKPDEPSALNVTLAEYIKRHEPGSRLHSLGVELLKAHGINRDRRAAVLAHEDLRKRLVTELGYARPEQWNGFIPPAMIDPGGDERLCASPATGSRSDVRYQLNQRGRYAIGEMPNDSHRRQVLLDISREAWARERRATVQAGQEQT